MIRKQHKGKTKKDKSELHGNLFLDMIKVHIVNIDSFILSEQFFSLPGIFSMQVNSHYFILFGLDLINNGFERCSCPTANIKEVSSRQRHIIDKTEMCSNCEEGADEHVIEGGRQLFQVFQHAQPNLQLLIRMQNKDIEKRQQHKAKTELGNLTPQQQETMLKEELGKRIRQRELDEIRKMSISEVNSIADREVEPPDDGSRQNKIRLYNYKFGLTEEDMQHYVKTPGQRHLQMLEKSQMLRRYKMRQISKDPVMAQIKRGKLGVDNFFILFGIFGSLLIPLYVYKKFRKHKEQIINSRIASPEVISRLEEDSPIDLDDVSYHTIHYYNSDRVREQQARKKKIAQIYKLEKELYF